MKGYVVSVNISKNKGEKKTPQKEALEIIEDFGLAGDGHSGCGNRQVSLLAIESIEKMRKKGLNVSCGDFAENITTSEISLVSLKLGTRIKIENDIILEVSQIGKTCNERCAIYYQAGDCVMPKEGIFAKVIRGGKIKKGDILAVSCKP